jgi:sugar phosphate isomerase/epimerase
MHISIVTDELSADPETAIELGTEWGVHHFELRGYYSDRVPAISPYQRRHLRAVLDDFGAEVIAVSPGLFKFPFPPTDSPRASLAWMEREQDRSWETAHALLRQHLDELLPAACDYAADLGARMVVAFSFARPPGPSPEPGAEPPPGVVASLRHAAELAAAHGQQLVIETEAGFWADTGANTAALVRAVDHRALGVNWDPGNVLAAGAEPYPAGYAAVRGMVRHVHFKDARPAPGGEPGNEPVWAIDGVIDWAGQVNALAADGYQGYISIEHHMRPKVASARASLERLRTLIAQIPATDAQQK